MADTLPYDPAQLDAETNGGLSSTQRVTDLMNQGYSWLPTQVLYSFAGSGLSNQDIQATLTSLTRAAVSTDQANAVKNQVKQQGGVSTANNDMSVAALQKTAQKTKKLITPSFGFKQFFDDPVLQKAPSVGLAIKQYISGAIGPWPIAQSHVNQIQSQLQIRGFGRDLAVDGTWQDPRWHQAYNDFKNQLVKSQLAGDKEFGSVSLGTVLKGLSALQPTNSFNAMLGFITSLPSTVRDVLADSVGGFAAGGSFLYNVAAHGNVQGAINQANVDQSNVISTLDKSVGHNVTSQQIQDRSTDRILGQFVQDVSTVLMLTSTMGAGGRLLSAIGGENKVAGTIVGEQLAADAAEQSGGTIAKLFRQPIPGASESRIAQLAASPTATRIARSIVGGGLGAASAELSGQKNPYVLFGATAGGAALGALSVPVTSEAKVAEWTKAFQNITGLAHTGPWIDRLLADDGWYYKSRSLLAKPYEWAPVRVAGNTFQQATLLGAEERGLAALQSKINPEGTQQSQAVQGEHFFDTVNDAVKFRIPYMGEMGGLDALQFFLHGPKREFIAGTEIPTPETKLSKTVGKQVNTMLATYDAGLQDIGVHGIAEMVIQQPWSKITKDSGGSLNANWMWSHIVADHAAWTEAQHTFDLTKPVTDGTAEALSDQASRKAVRALHDEILGDEARRTEAVKKLLAQGNGAALQTAVSKIRYETAVNTELRSNMSRTDEFAAMNAHARDNILPYLDKYVGDGETTAHRMLQGANAEEGYLTLAHNSRFSGQYASRAVNGLEAEYLAADEAKAAGMSRMFNPELSQADNEALFAASNEALPTVQKYAELDDITAWIFKHEFGTVMSDVPQHTWQERLQLMRDRAQELANDVTVHEDAPQALKDAVKQLNDAGWKLMNGKGTGFKLSTDMMLPHDLMNGELSFQRRVANRMGLNPNLVPTQAIATERKTLAVGEIGKDINNGRIVTNSPRVGAPELTRIIGQLAEGGASSRIREGVMRITGAQGRLERVAGQAGIDIAGLQAESNQVLSWMDLSRPEVVKVLSTPEGLRERFPFIADLINKDLTPEQQALNMLHHGSPDNALMDRASAENTFAAIRRANSKVPTSMMGASHLEELFRNLTFYMGKHWANNELGWSMANLPNRLVQFRNQFRFELDPWFSARRALKLTAKYAAEGVPPTWNPIEMMTEKGIINEARNIYERVMPEGKNEVLDAGEYMLRSQDVFIPMNQRALEMWGSYHWAQEGYTDAQIREKIIHTGDYGVNGVIGRSPLERTANLVFFPFSFEKTVARNLGGYLLDNPAQRIMLTKGLAAYDTFNREHPNSPLAVAWLEKHMPLFAEMEKLNMFAHGIGLGQVGGINRPLLNLFLPQSYDTSNPGLLDKLQKFIPAMQNFKDLKDELVQQGSVMGAVGDNMLKDLNGGPARDPLSVSNPGVANRASTLADRAQVDAAFKMEHTWFTRYAEFIDQNSKTTNPDKKARFSLDERWGSWAGETITKQHIRDIIHTYYPAYDARGAQKYAEARDADWATYLLSIKSNPALYEKVVAFQDDTHWLANAMDKNKFSAQDVRNYTAILRKAAIDLAHRDAGFYKLYSKKFQNTLGPLEEVK